MSDQRQRPTPCEALGHAFGEWAWHGPRQPMTRTCERCGRQESREQEDGR
jgi:hypothetical protein